MFEMPAPPDLFKSKAYFERITSQEYEKRHSVKEQALKAMDDLDGWCSKEKASIMIDFAMMLNAKTIVEIGVYGGKSLIPMAYALKELGYGKVYGIDPWSSSASIEGMEGINREWWGNLNHDAILRRLKTKIAQLGLALQITLIRNTSATAPIISDIDILHIDGNHSDEASMIDVTKWVPLVRSGGLIFFDDINWLNEGLAVSWLDRNCIRLTEFIGDNIWGIWVKP